MLIAKRFFNLYLLCLLMLASNLGAQNYFANNGGCIEGATISVAFTGETEINTCTGDELNDRVRFATNLFNMAYGYVVVDANDIIVSIGFSNFINFDLLPTGVLKVYSFSNYGLITASVGQAFSTATLAVPCFGLSGNFVTVNNAGAGETTIASSTGATTFNVCPGDGIADLVTVTSMGALPNTAYIITDDNGVVLAINETGVIDFDGAGTGVCRIYGFSYGSTLGVNPGDVLSEVTGFGCGGPSANFITVIRAMVNGGTIFTTDGGFSAQTCPGDGIADIISFESTGAVGTNQRYVVTDANAIIIGLPPSEVIDFEGAGTGECRVWLVSYEGDFIGVLGDNAAEAQLATGCFDLSDNFVSVIREVPVGGTVATVDGETEIATCPGDGLDDFVSFTATGQTGGNSTYVVTDENGVILGVSSGNQINFENGGSGTCRVYVLTYQGELSIIPGGNIAGTLATSCFELSDNFVNVIRTTPQGGSVTTAAGETEITTCPGDGLADLIAFESTGATGSNQTYVVTDANNIILGVPAGNEVDFEGAGLGACRVWVLAYEGELLAQLGDDAAATRLASGCFALSTNFVTVNRVEVVGATVATVDGETEVFTCPGDGVDDFISFTSTGGSDFAFTYVVTDADGTILGVPAGNEVNFEGAGTGACRLYGLTYLGDLLAAVDGNITDALATGCFALSSNFVTVLREVPTGGTVATVSGQTQVVTCPGDMVDDIVTVDFAGNSGGTTAIIVTDANGIILGLPAGNSVNLEDAGVGECRIYSVTYQGDLTAMVGDDVNAVELANSCFALSENFVTAVRDVPSGGTVTTLDGNTELTLCPGDELADVVEFTNVGASAGNLAYLITDGNNVILSISASSELDFTGAVLGECRVWTLSYEGIILAQPGDNAAEVRLASLCYSLSDNFVTVNRVEAVGGTVATVDGETSVTTCPGDGIEDVFTFVSEGGTPGLNFTFVVTDAENNILGVPGGATIDFENAGGGACRVWGLTYDGEITASPGDNAAQVALASGCFALSENFVVVNRNAPEGGTISLETGETEIRTCPNDGIPDIVRVDSTGTSLARFTYIITNEENVILSLPFGDVFNLDGAGLGVCRIWGFGYDGVFMGQPGDTVGVTQLTTDCSVLTENFVTVIRERPDGGTVSTEDGETNIFICPLDNISDVVRFASTGAAGGAFTYVVTDANNIILGVPGGNEVDFSTAGLGVCRLWGLSYQGNLIAQAGDNAGTVQLADGCFALSDNFVTVTREDVMGGTVATPAGTTMVSTCPGDGIADIVNFVSQGAIGPNFTYVVTDENNFILGVPSGSSQDFEDGGFGICRVWGLSFAGELAAAIGDNAGAVDLATGCFALSDNFITVVRTQPEGGSLSVAGSMDTIMVCSGDAFADEIAFDVTGGSNGSYAYIVAQEGFALATLPSSTFDFNNAQPGTYQVYGLAYAGNLSFIPGDPILESELATSCFDLSDNAIIVEIERVDGCEIEANGSAGPVYFCPQNPNDGLVEFTNCSDSDNSYSYIITSTTGVILTVITGNNFDFSFVPLPELLVYGVSYTGTLTAIAGTNINGTLSTGCYSLSDNAILIANDNPEAGEISFAPGIDNDFYCVANGMSDVVVNTTSTSLVGYAILVTDENDIVQLIGDLSGVDVTTLAQGNYRFYGLSYTGNLTVEVGDDLALVALADNCFELTAEFLPFVRGGDINGGVISIQTNQDTFYVCPMDGNPDLVLVNSTVTGVPYRYVVTDQDGDILIPDIFSNVINFDEAPEGICRIYGYAFTGTVTATFGANIATARLSDSCFALSENFIVVVRQAANGGSIATVDGATEVTIDINSEDTSVDVVSSGASDLINFTYVVTDDNNIVLGMGDGPTFDFANAGVGTCRIWGLSYQGQLTVAIGDDAAASILATSCFDLSSNFVTVIRTGEGIVDEDNDISALTITPYPNPVAGDQLQVVFSSETPLADGQAFLRDQNGRAWVTTNVVGGSTTTVVDFDISNLPTGLFVVQYRSGDRQEVVRFIRQ